MPDLLGRIARLRGWDTSDVAPPKPPSVRPLLPDISVQDWLPLAVALQPLDRSMARALPQGIRPENLRYGLDFGAQSTNLQGWVNAKLPNAMFFRAPSPLDPLDPATVRHEATHSWQGATASRYTNPEIEHSSYDYKNWAGLGLPFSRYGSEEQGEMAGDQAPVAMEFIRTHPMSDAPSADMALLDSLKSYLGRHPRPLRPISAVQWQQGQPKRQNTF